MKLSKFFDHDFKNGEFQLFDKNGKPMYTEYPPGVEGPDGFWAKYIRQDDFHFYMEFSDGYWSKIEYNKAGQAISKECSDGYWWKQEYDSDGNETVYTSSDDIYIDIEERMSTLDELCIDSVKDYKAGSMRQMFIDFVKIIDGAKAKNETNL